MILSVLRHCAVRKITLSVLPNESHQKLSLGFLALLGEGTIVVASRLRVKTPNFCEDGKILKF